MSVFYPPESVDVRTAAHISFRTDAQRQLRATVTPDSAEAVQRVRIDFVRGGQLPLLRCWLSVEAKKGKGGKWTAEVPLIDGTQPVAIMAQVFDQRGMMVSSAVHELRPAVALTPRPRATGMVRGVISQWLPPFGGWYVHTGTDLFSADPPAGRLEPGEIDGHRALLYRPVGKRRQSELATRLPVDPGVEPGNRNNLAIWIHDARSLEVRINYHLREPDAYEYQTKVTPGPGWHRVVLAPADFKPFFEEKNKHGDLNQPQLKEWNELHQIDLICDCVPGGALAVGEVAWQKRRPKLARAAGENVSAKDSARR